MHQIVDRVEWGEVVDPAWGIEFDGWQTGYDLAGWAASAWILHAMYEHPDIPAALTHDDVDRMERAAGVGEQFDKSDPFEAVLEEMVEKSTLIGSPIGASTYPGGVWNRLHWHELADRLGFELFGDRLLPSPEAFPYQSWPASIRPPAEGSLDFEQFKVLLGLLGEFSVDGMATQCIWWFAPLAGDFLRPRAYIAELREGHAVYALADDGGPNNFWPADGSWFVWTDFDLWATKVSGSRTLIDAVLEAPELEAQLPNP